MGLLDNGIKLGLGSSLAVGIGAVLLAPAVLPVAGSVVKPLMKATIKGGLILFGQGRRIAAETKETLEDLVAESKAELSGQPSAAGGEGGAQEGSVQTG